MKRLLAGLLVGMVAVVGCGKRSEPGGPGATRTERGAAYRGPDEQPTDITTEPVRTDAADTFTLSVPATEMDLKRLETEQLTISIDRGRTFDQEVKLLFTLPPGVTMTPAEPTIPAGQSKATVQMLAGADAPMGKHNVEVTAMPETGKPVTLTMTIEIDRD